MEEKLAKKARKEEARNGTMKEDYILVASAAKERRRGNEARNGESCIVCNGRIPSFATNDEARWKKGVFISELIESSANRGYELVRQRRCSDRGRYLSSPHNG